MDERSPNAPRRSAPNLGERRYTVMLVPEGARGPIRQLTIPLRAIRVGVGVAVAVFTVSLVGLWLGLSRWATPPTSARLLDENLALRGRIGEIEGKLDQVEEEMQRLRLYRTQLDDVPADVLPGFGPLDAGEVEAAAALGEGVLVDPGRLELLGEAGTPMDELPDLVSGDLEPGDAADHLSRRSDHLLAALRVAEIELGHRAEAAEHLRSYKRAMPSGWPIAGAVLTSGYGWRRSPFTRRWKFHSGLDLAAAKGTPVLSPASGTVVTADWQGGYGRVVEIDHGFGIMTRFAHNARLFVTEGDVVRRGQPVATVGMTGDTTGPHLHYEIHVDGVPVDPLEYLE